MAIGDSYQARMITEQMMYMYSNMTIKQLVNGYANMFDFLNPNSKTFDESDGGRFPQNPAAVGDTGLRDFITFSDSALDSGAGIQAPGAIGSPYFEGVNYGITVANPGSGNKYYIDTVLQQQLYLQEGKTYRFHQADSTNAGHPLRFSTTDSGTHGGGSEYTTGVTTVGTPGSYGSAGAYTQIVVASSTPTLYYYCTNHSGMGGKAYTPATGTISLAITVSNPGSGNKYYIDSGGPAPTISLTEGTTYRFDQADSSNQSHPLRLSTTSNGTHGGGTAYTTGVTTNGTAGYAGAYTEITVSDSAPTLYYYCMNHSGMGGQLNTPDVIIDSGAGNAIDTNLLKKQSFDLHKYDTVYDSNWRA